MPSLARCARLGKMPPEFVRETIREAVALGEQALAEKDAEAREALLIRSVSAASAGAFTFSRETRRINRCDEMLSRENRR